MDGAILQQLETALECPCCLERPRPDTTVVGLCLSGHMTCEQCAEQVVQRAPNCPVCRQANFSTVRGHKLAVSIIQIMTAFSLYSCKHLSCDEQVSGAGLARHEEICREKPVACPKHASCGYKAPIYKFFDGSHFNCVFLCHFNENSQTWSASVPIADIYSFDTSDITISNNFRPIILEGSFDGGNFVSHAFVNITKVLGMAVFYIGWLNIKSHAEEIYRNAKFSLSVYINTKYGPVGQFTIKAPLFEGEKIETFDEGVFVSKYTLFNWADWTKSFKCHECFLVKGFPHIHIEVKRHIV